MVPLNARPELIVLLLLEFLILKSTYNLFKLTRQNRRREEGGRREESVVPTALNPSA